MVYLIGSLRNPKVPKLANRLRKEGFEVFDDWAASGEKADDYLWAYEKGRGRSYLQALEGKALNNAFEFDKRHLEAAEAVVLVLPTGKSGHLELGWALGEKKKGYILLDKVPDRIDVMYRFATKVVTTVPDLIEELRK